MQIWVASVMLLSLTLQSIWSFLWQITEQICSSAGLTLVELGLLPNSRAGMLFFSFFPPKSIQTVSFAAICSLPLGLMVCCWGLLGIVLSIQACLCLWGELAHLHFFSSWQHWVLPSYSPLRFAVGDMLSASPHQPAVCPVFKPKAWIWFTTRCFSIFSA